MWFVMLRAGKELIMPLVDLEDRVALFATEELAEAAAKRNPLGDAYGYEVFECSVKVIEETDA